MKPYVLIALLLMLSAKQILAQTSSELSFHQNYRNKPEGGSEQIQVKTFPNPFAEQIQFQFDIIELSQVSITVFDITGNKIAVLMDKMLEKESYKLNWKPSQQLSGMYIYVFSAGKTRKTGKILLLNKRI
ncbi:T9SS type A sorting domain-containing protein [Rhodocytophaga rosea]|uniref:T9SS type A sorting domain-containing protein n=1 Tax=Rhodocytophaga rosea TaxID=2704465 RepID=A0A6C0GIZ3_9BACT|nr:T9SS type A sorting domain-containing protein [Rhodocytophaga rosea]QHT67925.1 T9SS type A sorting domain-containing protein [Rhodocytophaga rosea]